MVSLTSWDSDINKKQMFVAVSNWNMGVICAAAKADWYKYNPQLSNEYLHSHNNINIDSTEIQSES